MEHTNLVKVYRQLDFDLAKLHSTMNNTRENRFTLFMPSEGNCAIVGEQLNQLKARIDRLETPTKVFEFLKNHFNDFYSGLKMSYDSMMNNPQAYIYRLGWRVEPMILDAEDFTAAYDLLISRFACIKPIIKKKEKRCTTQQSRLEMVSKSLARETAKADISKAVTSIAIRSGRGLTDFVIDQSEKYCEAVGDRISIIEGNFNCNVSF